MLRTALPLVAASLVLTACEPAARCDRHITLAAEAVDSARAAKSGLGKLDADLLQASAKIASAEAQRIKKDYQACIRTAQDAKAIADDASTS